jgi:hypothetical protein
MVFNILTQAERNLTQILQDANIENRLDGYNL